MNEIINLDNLLKDDVMSVSIALLYTLKGVPEYSILSELPYILDYNNFVKLIKYYGGMTIRIPSAEDITDISRILLMYQNYKVSKLSWSDSLEKSGYTKEDSNSVRVKLQVFEKLLSKQEIGGRVYE